jgi:hypothetical protein
MILGELFVNRRLVVARRRQTAAVLLPLGLARQKVGRDRRVRSS